MKSINKNWQKMVRKAQEPTPTQTEKPERSWLQVILFGERGAPRKLATKTSEVSHKPHPVLKENLTDDKKLTTKEVSNKLHPRLKENLTDEGKEFLAEWVGESSFRLFLLNTFFVSIIKDLEFLGEVIDLPTRFHNSWRKAVLDARDNMYGSGLREPGPTLDERFMAYCVPLPSAITWSALVACVFLSVSPTSRQWAYDETTGLIERVENNPFLNRLPLGLGRRIPQAINGVLDTFAYIDVIEARDGVMKDFLGGYNNGESDKFEDTDSFKEYEEEKRRRIEELRKQIPKNPGEQTGRY